jgi:hypothetical protein
MCGRVAMLVRCVDLTHPTATRHPSLEGIFTILYSPE